MTSSSAFSTSFSSRQQRSTLARLAMSAIEQPAARSGRMAICCGAVMMSATSAMKCTPQKIDVFRICLRGQLGQLQRIAGQIGVLVDIGPLVVVAEDYGLLAQLGAGDADAVRAILVREVVEGGKGDRGGLHAVLLNISLSFVRYWCRIRHGEHFLCRQCASYGGLMACAHCCASVGCPINFSIICNC